MPWINEQQTLLFQNYSRIGPFAWRTPYRAVAYRHTKQADRNTAFKLEYTTSLKNETRHKPTKNHPQVKANTAS